MQEVQSDAELCTYLRHPWPRTQLLAEVVEPLPNEIDLYQIQIGSELSADASLPGGSAKAGKPDDDKAHKLSPAQRDLRRLREECDKAQTLVRLAGTTSDAAVLHRYLAVLGKSSLFAKAELRSIESLELPQGVLFRFQALVQVRAGYGQPGGPDGKTPAAKRVGCVKQTGTEMVGYLAESQP